MSIEQDIDRIIQTYSTSIIQIAFSKVKNLADAEDIAQDVLMTYFRKQPVFENAEHEKAWLIRVAVNKSKDLVKSRWFRSRVSLNEEICYSQEPQDEGNARLVEAVLELDDKYRLPIHLFYYEGYSIREIADILNKNPSTIATRLDRGRTIIRKNMEGKS